MTLDELQQIKKIIGDMRFMQAASLVASGMNGNKDAEKYMRNLARLEKLVQYEIEDLLKGCVR